MVPVEYTVGNVANTAVRPVGKLVRPGTRSVPESAQFGAQIGPEPNPAENSVLSSAEHPAPTYLAELLVPALLFSCTGETCQRRVHLADYSTEQSAVSYTAPWGPSLQQETY
ncbi:hypothetical protein VE00_10297 [Pseudogymnoascus sp. WSF 3629]|nr:hypothetical protein VE00_10297 [Pseudogymnoascus sp. WSF 3629]